VAICVSAIEKPPLAPTTLPWLGASLHSSTPELCARARGASSSAASTINLEAIGDGTGSHKFGTPRSASHAITVGSRRTANAFGRGRWL
jgi:hypothetical protein